jgi:hypothetical protein
VESYYISTGRLLPEFHQGYWLGLKGTAGGGPSSFRCVPRAAAGEAPSGGPGWAVPVRLEGHWLQRRAPGCCRWADNSSSPLAYQHWGLYNGKEREPNNR